MLSYPKPENRGLYLGMRSIDMVDHNNATWT